MKFSYSIQKISSLLALVLSLASATAQNTTRSPYSSFGIGDIETSGLANSQMMGDVKYAIADPYQINLSNPATYGSLRQPSFNVGINYNFLQINQGVTKQNGNVGYLKNICMVFPITKWWGFNAALTPLSKMGYRFTNSEEVDNFGDVNYEYEGEGGINRLIIGNGFNIINDTINKLSIGVNASYLFGNLNKTKRAEPQAVENALSVFESEQLRISDFNFEFGLYFNRKLSSNITLSLGGTYLLGSEVKTNFTNYSYTYKATSYNDIVKDTLVNYTESGNLSMPFSFGVGTALKLNRKQEKYHHQYLIAFDYSYTDWSSLALFGSNIGLAKRDQFSLGFQYIPDEKSYKNVQKMLNYRIGVRYANTHLEVGGNNLTEYGMSFGIGVPIIGAGQGTMFNLGLEAGRRGNGNVNPIYEQFTNIYLGFSLSPSKFDRWFYKSKID